MKFINNLLNDTTRALIIAFFPDLINLAVSLGLEISEDAQKIWISALTKGVVLLFYVVKTGQGNPPPPPELTIGEKLP